MLIQIEYIDDPRPIEIHRLSRVPYVGEFIATDEETWSVQVVLHILDAMDGEPVAMIRVLP